MNGIYKPQPAHRPHTLTEELLEKIIEATPQVLVVNQIAGLCMIPRSTLKDWMATGIEDAKSGKDTIFAQLSARFHEAKAKEVRILIAYLRTCPKNYQSVTWILEKCFREDFGADSEELKELRELFKQILPLIGKGDAINGKETEKPAIEAREETISQETT